MKHTNTCPKCQSAHIWVIEKVGERDDRATDAVRPAPVTTLVVPPKEKSFWDSGTLREVGTFEVWICEHCGFTEWYAQNVNDQLAQLAADPRNRIRRAKGNASGGPFR